MHTAHSTVKAKKIVITLVNRSVLHILCRLQDRRILSIFTEEVLMEISLKLVILFGLINCALCQNTKLQEVFSWKHVDFDFPDESARQEALKNEDFIPKNNLPLGLEVWKNKLFVTCPRWKGGTAASLTYIDLEQTKEKSPKLKPYPNWEAHNIRQDKPGTIVNVFRLNVDVCDRLWLIDTGMNGILDKREIIRRKNIQVYNLLNDQLIREYIIPETSLKPEAFLANIVVETSKENCNKAFAYIPDLAGNALIVYSLEENDSWIVTHHFFHFDPLFGDYNIAGINFQWTDGIFGVALSPEQSDGYSTLYFHPMSSSHEFAVSTKILRNKTIASNAYHEFKVLGSRGPNSQATAISYDNKTGVLFYTLLNKDAVGCWNPKSKDYSPETNAVIVSDHNTMVFPNDLKVDKNGTLWVLTDRLPEFLFSHLDYDEDNFRILKASTEDVIKGTVCDKSSS